MKVKELIDKYAKYLKQTVGVSESTRHQYLRYVKHFLSEAFKEAFEYKLGNLKPSDLIQYVKSKRSIIICQFSNL